ncbi:MAG: hypothetical protein IPN34_16935 [Planctomycetes bacterium]|nr:hypothetical protein [Planctomycetota bacterium]
MMRTLAERKVRVPDVVVALIVRRMVAGAGELAERLAQVAGELPQPIKNELLAGRIKAPPRGENFASAWSWERPQDGEPLESVPAISDSLLELLRLQCENTPFGIDIAPRKQGGGYRAYVPNRTMLDALKRGKVISLSVEEPVFALLDALPIRFELFSFWPSTLRAIGIQVNRQDVVGTGGSVVTVDRLGAGKRVACSPKRERSKQARNQNVEVAPAGVSEPDAMFRRLVRELARLHVEGRSGYESMRGGPLGAVVHGADLLALEADSDTKWMIETEEGRSTIKFATYGANHASTDELSDCSLLIVRRWTLHPDEFERWTRIHLAIFPGEAPVKGSIDRIERWDGLPDDAPGILVHGPADPLTAACCSVFETYALLNAAGRSRGHATDQPRTVLVASGSPVWGLRLSELVDEKELFERFGARIDLVDADLRRGRVHGRARLRAIAKQKRKALLELIEREGMLSRRELAARLDVKERQVDRWLRKHRVSSRAGEPGYEAFVGEVLEDVADAWRSQIRQSFEQAHFQPHSNRVSIQMGPKLSLSGYGAVAVGEELERQGLRVPPRASLTRYLRTVRAALTGEDLELPSQERRRVECLLVAGALGALVLAEEAAQEEQPVRGKRRRGSA